jgi:hypothetical protein
MGLYLHFAACFKGPSSKLSTGTCFLLHFTGNKNLSCSVENIWSVRGGSGEGGANCYLGSTRKFTSSKRMGSGGWRHTCYILSGLIPLRPRLEMFAAALLQSLLLSLLIMCVLCCKINYPFFSTLRCY